jgi:copper resistance protein B
MQNRVRTLVITLMALLYFTTPKVFAQKAPAFSNELMMGDHTYLYLIADKLEYRAVSGINPMVWDVQGYLGKDLNKFWFKLKGEALTRDTEADMQFHGLYSRAIGPYFDVQGGIRYDLAYEGDAQKSRGFAVVGLKGLAPYFFEVDSGIYISEDGDISASVEAEYDLLLTQRLIGQPLIETKFAVQEVEEWGVGSGFNSLGVGFRLRYEIRREFAPYIGINWERKLGQTADMIRADGGDVGSLSLLGGVRMWF